MSFIASPKIMRQTQNQHQEAQIQDAGMITNHPHLQFIISGYWKTSSPVTISATASDTGLSGLKNVTLYYRYRASNETSWGSNVSYGVDIDPWVASSWSFSFPNGTGHYQFYSIAKDNATNIESSPGGADAGVGFDDQAPSSFVNTITEYWKSSSPVTITVIASDAGSGVKNVTLFCHFSSNNASWEGWVNAGVDTVLPWSWSFELSNGTGYYQFYSIARDNLSNAEAASWSADAGCGYDTTAPSSSVTAIIPYWKNVDTVISASASDGLSGIRNVTLYYRFSNDNASWGKWMSAGMDAALPWSWTFAFPNGTGYYQFYSIAKDNAKNAESTPGNADALSGYENQKPTSSVNAILEYLENFLTVDTQCHRQRRWSQWTAECNTLLSLPSSKCIKLGGQCKIRR